MTSVADDSRNRKKEKVHPLQKTGADVPKSSSLLLLFVLFKPVVSRVVSDTDVQDGLTPLSNYL